MYVRMYLCTCVCSGGYESCTALCSTTLHQWCVLACECFRSPSPCPSPQEWLSGATPCPFISAAVEASVLKENEVALRRAVRDQLQPLRDHLQTYGVCA